MYTHSLIHTHTNTPSFAEDSIDLGMVKTSMSAVLLMDTQNALTGIFDQICGEDEAIREKGIEYVSTSLVQMRHKLFIPHPENEKFLVEMVKKVSSTLLVHVHSLWNGLVKISVYAGSHGICEGDDLYQIISLAKSLTAHVVKYSTVGIPL